MARGRKTALTMQLTADERQTLMAWQRSTTIRAGRARRGRIILLLADGIRSPMSPRWWGSAGALSPSGRSVFCRMDWKVWQASLAAAGAEGRLALTLTHIAGMGNFHPRSRVSPSRETSSATPPPRKVHTGALGWQRWGSGGTIVRERQGTHPERSEGYERPDRHLPRLSRRAA